MIERRPFAELPSEDCGGLISRRHFCSTQNSGSPIDSWGCMRVWNDEEIPPNAGFAQQLHTNIEIITYVREGTITHRDSLGNEGRIEAGSIQVVSAGAGIRHAEYNLEPTTARIFQIWITPASAGGSPAWGVQPCTSDDRSGHFVPIASCTDYDREALPIRACARVLKATLTPGESINYSLREPRLAYLVPSYGSVDVGGVRIDAGDGAAIRNVDVVTITAIEATDLIMVDVLVPRNGGQNNRKPGKDDRETQVLTW